MSTSDALNESPVRTISEAAARLHVCRAKVYRLIRAGDLKRPAGQLGREPVVTVASIVALEARLGWRDEPAEPKPRPRKQRRPDVPGAVQTVEEFSAGVSAIRARLKAGLT